MFTDYLKNILGTIVPASASIAFSLLAAKMLGLTVFGELIFAIAAIDFIDKIIGVSTWQAYQKFLTNNEENDKVLARQLFTIDLFFGLLSFLIAFVFLFVLIHTKNQYTNWYFLLLTLNVSRIFDIAVGIHRSAGNYGLLSIILSIGPIVKIILLIYGFFYLEPIISLVLIAYSAEKIITIFLKFISLEKSSLLVTKSIDLIIRKYLVNIYFDSTLRIIPRRLDVIIMNFFVASAFLGSYQLLKDFSLLLNYALDPFYQISFRKIKSFNKAEATNYVSRITINFLKASPLLLVFYVGLIYLITSYLYPVVVDHKLILILVLSIPNIIAMITILFAPYILVIDSSETLRRVQSRAIVIYSMYMVLGVIIANHWIIITGNVIYYVIWATLLKRRVYA